MMILYRQTVICHNMTQKRILDFYKDGQLEKRFMLLRPVIVIYTVKETYSFFQFLFCFGLFSSEFLKIQRDVATRLNRLFLIFIARCFSLKII